MNLSGKCLCGAISYTCKADPVLSVNCHCNDCRRSSGSAYSPSMFLPENCVSISGEVKYFESKGSSGKIVSRGFCPTCGSQMFAKLTTMPDMLAIRAGSLDDTSKYKPKIDIFTGHAVAWDVLSHSL